jgi:hypothetical protein
VTIVEQRLAVPGGPDMERIAAIWQHNGAVVGPPIIG